MSYWDLSKMVWPPRTSYTTDQIPDLSGKVALVTGGNKGIGKEMIHHLLRKNAKVYLGARSASKAEAAIEELYQLTGKKAIFLEVDMADFDSVKTAAANFLKQEERLDILFNNAGILSASTEKKSPQGYELALTTNTLSPYLFTKLLLPTLKSTAASTGTPTRMVWAISSAPFFFKNNYLDYSTFKLESLGNPPLGGNLLYGQSKSGAAMLAQQLARKVPQQDGEVYFLSIDPGGIRTDLFDEMGSVRMWFQNTFINNPVWKGALTSL
ncbi:hypothetical protein CI109_105183 [Kwoniella shandongensis]|uniref:Uncharacterized protein n=1 Tax=Kwoniella shandongensis TaxID=1734106 RepID=A0A5M6C8T0_9TREE|nr:uncharacterized protein CI109_002024 [Kwoniella shandongensis]KAA5529599.1 hypothetical protein CI109_002024 [Kwoniella shandongensis]